MALWQKKTPRVQTSGFPLPSDGQCLDNFAMRMLPLKMLPSICPCRKSPRSHVSHERYSPAMNPDRWLLTCFSAIAGT